MKKFYCKESAKVLAEIQQELASGNPVEVNNEYETFYGVGFDKWLRDGLQGITCKIVVTSVNKWYGYPWTYVITPL